MPANSHQLELEEVLGDYAGLQRLARSFVADEHAAEDLLQQAMEHAVKNPSWQAGKLRAWLRGTLRNLSKQHFRGDSRRRLREAKVSIAEDGRDAEVPTVDMLAAELESRELMLQAVNQLPELYKDTVLLYHMQGRSLKEIGEQMNTPTRTVETRLYRGRERIRKHLEGRYGKEAFGLMLLPLAYPSVDGGLAAALNASATMGVLGGATAFLQQFRIPVMSAAMIAAALLLWQPWKEAPLPPSTIATLAQEAGKASGETLGQGSGALSRQNQEPGAVAESTPAQPAGVTAVQQVQLVEAGSNRPMPKIKLRAACLRPALPEEILLGPEHPQWFRPRERVWWRLQNVEGLSDAQGMVTWEPHPETQVLFIFLDIHNETHSIEDYSRGRREIAWKPGADPYRLELMPRQGDAIGTVVLEDGTPLADASVDVTYHWILKPQLAPQRAAQTLANGSFRLDHLANDQGGFHMVPRKAGYASVRSLSVMRMAGHGETYENIQLVMAPEVLRRVRVVDEFGTQVPQAKLHAEPAEEQAQPEFRLGSYSGAWRAAGQTDALGNATLSGIPAQAWKLEVEHLGQLRWSGILPAQQEDIEILLNPRASLSVLVQDQSGQAVANAMVLVWTAAGQSRATTNLQGQVDLAILEFQPAVVAVVAPSKALWVRHLSVAEAQQRQAVVLAEGLSLTGKLTDWPGKTQGAAPPQVFVRGQEELVLEAELQQAANLPLGLGRVVSFHELLELDAISPAADGSFAVNNLSPGMVELWAGARHRPIAHGLFAAGSQELRLQPEDGMASLAKLQFQVEDARSGEPVPNYYVVLQELEPQTGQWIQQPIVVVHSADGRQQIPGLRPNTYRLLIWAPVGYVTASLGPITLAAGTKEYLVRLEPSTSIQLRLHQENGAPLSGIEVLAMTAEGKAIPFTGDVVGRFLPSVRSHADGHVTLSGIPRHTSFQLLFRHAGKEVLEMFTADPTSQDIQTVTLPF